MRPILLFYSLLAVVVCAPPGCLKNGATCKSDGSQGLCCSGFCYQEQGKNAGKCKGKEEELEKCREEGETCEKRDGMAGNCCNFGECIQDEGEAVGICRRRTLLLELPSWREVQLPKCLANGSPCQMDGSMGNCCTGYCHQRIGEDSGKCRKRPVTKQPPV